jgi:hypothetical protein
MSGKSIEINTERSEDCSWQNQPKLGNNNVRQLQPFWRFELGSFVAYLLCNWRSSIQFIY